MAEKCEFVLEPKATEFTGLIQSMTGKHQLWELWADFIALTAISCANYYERGVNDALTAVSFARPEQQTQPASEVRTNLDRIRAMSAEEIAKWMEANLGCCSCPISDSQGYSCEIKNCMSTFIKWLNSPAKEDTE